MKKFVTLVAIVILFSSFIQPEKKIVWLTFEEAVELNKTAPKKFLIDIYTDWCGWCKKMDKDTYEDEQIIEMVNKNFYAIKFDAETKDSIKIVDRLFINPDPNNKRSPHQLAVALMKGQMSYPTTVFLEENLKMIAPVQGYYDSEGMGQVLSFYGDNHYKSKSWDSFVKESRK